jgi:predicted translin family RNA/ssDNA-binding protein
VVPVYLGGLVDLTGEIGRLAVAAGTKRELEKVKQCYEVSTYSYIFEK